MQFNSKTVAILCLSVAGLLGIGSIPLLSQSLGQNEAQSQGETTPTEEAMPMMSHDAMNMSLGTRGETFDLRFLDAMILHHQGAVEMAQQVLEQSSRTELRELAESIITAQEAEIAQMQTWRQAWYPNAPTEPIVYHAEMGHDMPMPLEMQQAMKMEMDLGVGEEFDQNFLTAMIVHHEGALNMAQQVLDQSDRPELRELAQAILTTQQAEITQMQQWQQSWFPQ